MNKNGANSQANVVKSDEDDVFLATNDEVAKIKWVMDSTASKHICRDREMFDTWMLRGQKNKDNLQKNKGNFCYLDEQALKRNHDSKVKKKVKFSNVVEVLGETSVGRGVCSLSI